MMSLAAISCHSRLGMTLVTPCVLSHWITEETTQRNLIGPAEYPDTSATILSHAGKKVNSTNQRSPNCAPRNHRLPRGILSGSECSSFYTVDLIMSAQIEEYL
jgi:hypothetical protein